MKILFLTKYTKKGASSRYRTFQYLDLFKQNGINFKYESFFNDKHIENINNTKSKFSFNLIYFILRRINVLSKIKNFDIVFIEKEMIPYFPAILERIIKWMKVKIILDYDDAVFHNYDTSKSLLVRVLLKNKIKKIMSLADHIIVGSTYLMEYALKYNSNVTKIPTSIDIDKYGIVKEADKSQFIIGWIGSTATSYYLNTLLDQLVQFTGSIDGRLHLIGYSNSRNIKYPDYVKIIPWNEETEVIEINKFSIGISLLDDTPFAKGKCAFKIVQYMACGKPVIASSVGENSIIVKNDINGFLADDINQWLSSIKRLYKSPDLRSKFGGKNRSLIENNYTIQGNLINYLSIFKNVIN